MQEVTQTQTYQSPGMNPPGYMRVAEAAKTLAGNGVRVEARTPGDDPRFHRPFVDGTNPRRMMLYGVGAQPGSEIEVRVTAKDETTARQSQETVRQAFRSRATELFAQQQEETMPRLTELL